MAHVPSMAQVLLNQNKCPSCGELSLHGRKRICPSCDAHLRYLGDTNKPIARNFWIFNPERGWLESTAEGVKLEFDQACVPTMPSHLTPETWEDEQGLILTEQRARECGTK